jgi:hypothetical protein
MPMMLADFRRSKSMKKIMLGALIAFSMAVAAPSPVFAATSPAARVVYQPLPKPGEKVSLDADHYFIYGFEKQPKLGVVIMRVEIFSRDGKHDTSFVVKGDADMPSMRGAHSNGEKEYSLSAKGAYLKPVRLVMPGDWEVTFVFMKKGKVVFRGAYLFDL